MPQQPKKFHHLIVGEIVFRHRNSEDIHGIRLNGILIDDQDTIPVRLLGKAQQILQLNFHKKMQDENIEVLDVILQSFSPLGQMTEEEFHAVPEGVKVEERKAPLTVVPTE